MDMLDEALAAAVGARDDVLGATSDSGGDQHNPSDHAIDLLPLSTHEGASEDTDADAATRTVDGEGPQLPRPPSHSAQGKRKRRPRVGKRLQLLLIKKYVQYARQFQRLPDRIATEQLLQQGHDEFYYEGGDLGEPRLTYPAFMKLVRNRRSEFARSRALRGSQQGQENGGTSAGNDGNDAANARATTDRDQREIRALIEELDRVRHRSAPPRVSTEHSPTANNGDEHLPRHTNKARGGYEGPMGVMDGAQGVQMLPVDAQESLGMVGGGETDHSGMEGEQSTAEGYASAPTGMDTEGDNVFIPRAKLELILRAAQDSLRIQQKLLEDVRAIEQRLAGYR